jgi:HAE1 family hydrophobic/amphiphilic exporter-1
VLGRLQAGRDALLDRIHALYGALLHWAMRHRLWIVALAFVTFFGSFALVPLIGSEFAPQADLGEVQVTIKTRVGSSIEYTRAKVQQAQAALAEFPEVEYSYATVISGGAVGKNSATIYVHLTDHKQRSRSQKQLQDPIRERLNRIAGIEISVGAPGGLGGGKPIQVSIQGADIAQLEKLSKAVMATMHRIPGLVDIDSSLEAAKPTLAVEINRELASDLGLGVEQIASALRPLVAGEIAGAW